MDRTTKDEKQSQVTGPRAEAGRGTALRDWGGAAFYVLTVGLLMGVVQYTAPVVLAAVLLLALTPLAGLLRRRPVVALALTLTGGSVVAFSTRYHTPDSALVFLPVAVVLGFVVATRPRRTAAAAVGVASVLLLPAAVAFARGPSEVLTMSLITVLSVCLSSLAGLLLRQRGEHAVALRTQEVSEAVTAERLRIARELHDMVAHSIGVIAIQAGVAGRVIDTQPAEARAALRAIETTSRETLSGLRRTLVALRRAQPDGPLGRAPLGPAPGLADLEALVAATADAGVRADVRWEGERRQLEPDIDLSAYRIVQEALTNVVRHAGTGHCRVTIGYGEEAVTVEVLDDGRGARSGAHGEGTGFGIEGMRERVSLLHGRFSAGPRPEGGFRVAAELPLPVAAGVEESR
ncbi:sensor histidine kinase [Streptomyces sp. NBC_00249]|uniref:sensor histidine kinase n=1 Tax=Streptomyces sp. NBC_00249 TaxID=2975690 RepID=UPI0022528E62|nr:sensor histidine kinase [Streptomyces sp. NBC_00249]MCX5197444.1 sensor histidine kinase [Streptomyces sp. NBC_00249]